MREPVRTSRSGSLLPLLRNSCFWLSDRGSCGVFDEVNRAKAAVSGVRGSGTYRLIAAARLPPKGRAYRLDLLRGFGGDGSAAGHLSRNRLRIEGRDAPTAHVPLSLV